MGTDINYLAERKTVEGWARIDDDFYFGGDRNYVLFAVVAGIRAQGRDIPLLARPRGLPIDLSVGAQAMVLRRAKHFGVPVEAFCQDDLGHHSHSWLTLRELMDYSWSERDSTRATGEYLHAATFRPLSKLARPEDVRIVFWFDD